MSDLTTPQEILNLVKRMSIDPRSSGRRHRILRGMVRRCFSRHPHLLDSFVDINGVEALVVLLHSRPSAKYCGECILKQLYNICMNLEQPNHGVQLMIELCKTLGENGSVYSCWLVFLACYARKWIKHDISFFVLLVVNLFKGVDSMLARHVKHPELEPADKRLYVLIDFSKYFEFVGEEITKHLEIRDICSSLMDTMSILLRGFARYILMHFAYTLMS